MHMVGIEMNSTALPAVWHNREVLGMRPRVPRICWLVSDAESRPARVEFDAFLTVTRESGAGWEGAS